MKKLYYFFIIASIICSCGNNRSNNATENDYDSVEVEKYHKPQTIVEACSTNDYEVAHEILERYRRAALNHSKYSDDSENRAAYLSALESVYTSELTYIALNYPQDMDIRILVRMNEMVPLGEKPQQGLVGKYDVEEDTPWSTKGFPYNSYAMWVNTYNAICNKLFDVAVVTKNQHLAQSAVSFTKENVSFTQGHHPAIKVNGVTVDIDHAYVQYVKTDIKAIKERYNDAVKSGLFK